jgi:GNAT superfamily N-acetyltransferase
MFAGPELAHRIDLVEAALVRGVVSRIRERRPEVGAFATQVAGGWALFAGAGNPVNKVIGFGFDAVPDETGFTEIECAHEALHVEVRAEVATLARAETLAWLSRRGYHLQGFENVLGQPLPAGGAAATGPGAPSGIDVRPADGADIDAWVRTVTAGFAAPDDSGAGGDQPLPDTGELASIMDDVFRAGGSARYLAVLDGEIAGGASMRVDGRIALLAGAATLPPFRRRGVQRALLARRLEDASRAGCDLAVVVTQPGSISQANSQRQGFSLLYSRAVMVKG